MLKQRREDAGHPDGCMHGLNSTEYKSRATGINLCLLSPFIHAGKVYGAFPRGIVS